MMEDEEVIVVPDFRVSIRNFNANEEDIYRTDTSKVMARKLTNSNSSVNVKDDVSLAVTGFNRGLDSTVDDILAKVNNIVGEKLEKSVGRRAREERLLSPRSQIKYIEDKQNGVSRHIYKLDNNDRNNYKYEKTRGRY